MAIIQGPPSTGRNVGTVRAKPVPVPVHPAVAAALAARPSLTAAQVANQRVNQQLNPQIAAANAFNTHQDAVIQSFARSLLGQLKPTAGQVGADYNQAIQQVQGLSGQAAQYLSGQNPAASQQSLEASVGAPPEQQAQAAQALGNVFRGGAGALAFQQGVVPGAELAGDKAASQTFARTLPTIAALKGKQDLASAMWQQGQDRAKLEATRPQLYQSALQDIRTNQAAQARQKESVREFNIGEKDKAAQAQATAVYRAAQLNKPTYYTDSFGRRVQVSPTGTQTVMSAGQYKDATGAVYQVGIDDKQTLLTPGRPAKTPAPPKLTRDPNTGAYFKENPDGSLTKVYQGGAPPAKTSGGFTLGNTRYNPDGTVLAVGPKSATTPHTSITVVGNRKVLVDDATGAKIKDLGPAPITASSSAPTTKTINGVTYQWDKGGRGWVPAKGLPAATAKKTGGLTGASAVKYSGIAETIAEQARHGFTTTPAATTANPNPTPIHHPALTYDEAFNEMLKEGIPESLARKKLNRWYPVSARSVNPVVNPAVAGPPNPAFGP